VPLLSRLAAWDVLLPVVAVLAVAAYLVAGLAAFSHRAAIVALAASYVVLMVWLSGRPRDVRLTVFISQAAVLIGVYAAEIYASHRKYETTSLLGEADRLRAKGEDAWPAIPPSTWYGHFRNEIDAGGRTPLLLAGLSNVKSVLCIEAVGWVHFQSDRFGFRNPPRPAAGDAYDVVLIGDSFTQGTCVPDGDTMADHLRRSGLSLLNLGMHGSGPLFELAILQEYAARPRTARIVWFFYEGNDMHELARESRSVMLPRYLTDGAFQGLENRQDEIDAAIKTGLANRNDRFPWRDIVRLKELRVALGLQGIGHDGDLNPEVAPLLPLLGEVLGKARRFTEDKGAAFTLVYLPTPWRFNKGTGDAVYFPAMEKAVTDLACRTGIDFLSMTRVVERSPDPLAYYASIGGARGHFTADGYRLAADTVRAHLAGQTQSDCPTR
jgi:hypothetical protein